MELPNPKSPEQHILEYNQTHFPYSFMIIENLTVPEIMEKYGHIITETEAIHLKLMRKEYE